ncbi:hypothetical protein BH11PSE13_BH11PSE13_05550 [soil metagenome]
MATGADNIHVMNTEYGTLDKTPSPVEKPKRNVWLRPVALLVGGIALAVLLSFVLR